LFDPATTPPHKMGAIATALWRTPGAVRGDHPVTSWAAVGPEARALVDDPPLDDPEGRHGTVGRNWARDGWVLLLGTDHDTDTTLHLAESMLEMPHLLELPDRYPAVDADGRRVWRPVRKTTKCSDAFLKIEPLLAPHTTFGQVGGATAKLLRARVVVEVATALFRRDPTALLCDDPECVHCPTSRRALAGWAPPA
ncbi:MAG: AAC(3) family N-acetyltransferase, partial [Myxococcota bacterium]